MLRRPPTLRSPPRERSEESRPEVRLGADDGMPADCALSFDNIAVIPRAYFVERITKLGPDRLTEVCRALTIATGC